MILPSSHTLSDHYMKIAFYCLGGWHPYLLGKRVQFQSILHECIILNYFSNHA